MHEYYAKGAAGKFLSWWSVVIYAGFCIAGPDMIALAAGEIQNPRRTIPRVARMIFYRLVGFYVVGVLCVGIICSSKDTALLGAIADGASGAAASPWVIGIQNLGISVLPHFINALILLSALSCGNAYVFACTRTLYGLARGKFLPHCIQPHSATDRVSRQSSSEIPTEMHQERCSCLLRRCGLSNLLHHLSGGIKFCYRGLLLVC
jgi:amino acid transporter